MSLPKSTAAKRVSSQKTNTASQVSDMQQDLAEESFLAAFESILVDEPVDFEFDGSLNRVHMRAVWRWIVRDIAPDLPATISSTLDKGGSIDAVLDSVLQDTTAKVRKIAAEAETSAEVARRVRSQLGGEEVKDRLPVVLYALRCRGLLAKANAFGRASNSLPDEAALGAALQSMPLNDPHAAALLFHAVVGQSTNPSKLMSAVVVVAGGASEAAIKGAGFAPLVDGILAHAQNQFSRLKGANGALAKINDVSAAITRFHKLVRAISAYVELDRTSRWSMIISQITKNMAQRVEPRLREVSADVSQSMRRPREGADRVDAERLQAALDGMTLLSSIRDAKESMALNALFDKAWTETGQSLEVLLNRNLDLYKQDPSDKNTEQRLNMGIEMAKVRFNEEYAEILRRAAESVRKRG